MVSLPQLRRDVGETEAQLRFTRNRLACYELLDDRELAEHTARVVAGLEDTKQILLNRIQEFPHVKV